MFTFFETILIYQLKWFSDGQFSGGQYTPPTTTTFIRRLALHIYVTHSFSVGNML